MSMTSEGAMDIIRHPASFASARARSVLPVPGGPNKSTPVIPCSRRMPVWNASGNSRGSETTVLTESIVCAGRWT
jgi:hypothetical protein